MPGGLMRSSAVRRALASASLVVAIFGFISVGTAAGASGLEARAGGPVSTSDLVLGGREIAGERSATARTFRVARGAYVTRVYGSAVNARRSGGRFERLASRLESVSDGFRLHGQRVDVRLPRRLSDGTVRVAGSGGADVSYRLVDAGNRVADVRGVTAEYPAVFASTDVRLTALAGGIKEDLQLTGAGAPSRFVFELTVPDGATARLTKRGSVSIDTPGDEDFVIAAPFMLDAARHFAPKGAARYELREAAGGVYRLALVLDERWLHASERRFPVTVDPTITATGATQTTDASLLESVPDQGYGASEGIFVGEYDAYPGYDNRGVLRFDLGAVPSDAKVLQAKLGLQSYYTENSTPKKIGLHALTHSFTTDATWDAHDGTNAWGSAGGDFDATPSAVASVDDNLGWNYWYPTELAQAWVDGSRDNDGLLLKDMPGEPENGTEFRSSEYGTAEDRPYMDVLWYPRTGISPAYTYDEHQLKDGSTLKVNLQNGNVVLARPDTIGTGPGEDFVMGHYFNSMAEGTATTGGFGATPWVTANGKFVGATVMGNGDFIHQGFTGYVLPFLKQQDGSFKSPPELDATLVEDPNAGWGERYELTYADGSKMTFAEDGTWMSHTDSDNHTYTLNYPAPSYQHTSVTGTDDADTTFTYTTGSLGQDLLSSATNPDDNTVTFSYTSDRLTGEARNSSTAVTYSYDTNGRLDEITDGDGNVTQLSFDADGRVESITEGPDSDDPTTTYDYGEPDASCADGAAAMTTVEDPSRVVAGHCFTARGAELASDTDIKGENSGDLEVRPTENPQTGSFASGGTAWVIARMPSTKTITQVTLGDFGKASGCSSTTTATLSVAQLGGPYPVNYSQIGHGTATIPTEPGRVTWNLSSPTSGRLGLLKDKSYRFTVTKDSGCDLRRTTWQHDASTIDGGPQVCNHGPETTTNSFLSDRIWHTSGQAETSCNVIDMNPSLGSGWYATRYIGFGADKHITAGANWDYTHPAINQVCPDFASDTNSTLYGLHWTGFGSGDVACEWTNYAPFGVRPKGGWHYAPAWQPGTVTRPRAMYAKLTSITYDELLDAYAPRLIYDSEEDYHPDAWETATDALPSELRDRSNIDGVLASHGSGPQLSPAWLVPFKSPYPGQGNGVAERAHYLDLGSQRGQDMPAVAATVRSSGGGYTDKTYARAVRGSDDRVYLQYWFWYFYNHANFSGALNHEGDWEFIQIRVDGQLQPAAATYSQHEGGEACDWDEVPKTNDGRPKAWPSRNRHANYFEPGQHNPFLGFLPGVSIDTNDGDGDEVDPQVIDISTEPSFVDWPGRWGATLNKQGLPLEADSPRGPKHNAADAWDPAPVEERAEDCSVG